MAMGVTEEGEPVGAVARRRRRAKPVGSRSGWAGEMIGGPRARAVQAGGDEGDPAQRFAPLMSAPHQQAYRKPRERDGPGTRQGATARGVGGKPRGVWGGAARGANRDRERDGADWDDRRGAPATNQLVTLRMITRGAGSCG
jgi:hypothetical protein